MKTYRLIIWLIVLASIAAACGKAGRTEESSETEPATQTETAEATVPLQTETIRKEENTTVEKRRNPELIPERQITGISVSSRPEGYRKDYSDAESIKRITDYFDSLTLTKDFSEKPEWYHGLTWVVELLFADGSRSVIYHFGNMFVRADDGPWYRIEYEEGDAFGALLEKNNETDIAGKTFVWEKKGFGSPFALTLREDGTYQYYVGALSSYIGMGCWTAENGVLMLFETSGYSNVFRFRIREKELAFMADGSGSFLYVSVSDGDRFFMRDEDRPEAGFMTPILVIEANGKRFYAVLEDNSSAEALIEKLSGGAVTVEMHDYGSFEKVGSLPWELPRNDVQITTGPGDVILYQGDQITVYYDTNSWNFTRLARIEGVTKEELLDAFGTGNVSITFWLEWGE